ncbi:NADH-quinone oxidoreductase [Armatimonadota bacterium]|nr:NADH-quinone oxidoreductase [Armatimonadota bacterium]
MPDNRLTQTEASLNPAVTQMVNIKIDGIELQVPKGENIIESAKRAGVDIPYFCYHPRLSKGDAANCRMCLVDVFAPRRAPDGTVSLAKMPKPQASCTLPADEGMVIVTDSEAVVRDRKGVLEFLLINHPLDCPICDRGGECPLQNNAIFYGAATSRYTEEKRHFPKAYPLAENVVFDRERCIHCARCTRFTEDISGDAQLGFLKRGADMEVGTFEHTAYKSKFSGNVIELCPVGALLSRSYRFKARPWDLHSQRSICSKCSNGCNIKVDYRLDSLQRINGRINEAVNEEWTCDKGKFGHSYVSSEARLKTPMLKTDGEWKAIDWTAALQILVGKLRDADGSVAGIGGQRCTNEDNFAFQKRFREVLKSNDIDSRVEGYLGSVNKPLYERFGYHAMGNAIAELEDMKTIFVLGSQLVDEQPIIYLRVRKAYRFKGATVINAVSSVPEDSPKVGDFAQLELVYKPGTEAALLKGILSVLSAEKLASVNGAAKGYTLEKAVEETGVSAEAIQQAARLMATGKLAVIAGREIANHTNHLEVVQAIGDLAEATGNAQNINLPGEDVNSQGASDMGVLPDFAPGYVPIENPGKNTTQILQSAADGNLKVLWVAGAKLLEKFANSELAQAAFASDTFVVVNELTMTETAQAADLVLPAASFVEKDGTFTNCERRVQRIYKAFDISLEIKPDWLIFSEIAARLGGTPYFSARDILRDISAQVPAYEGITPKSLGDEGVRWEYPAK